MSARRAPSRHSIAILGGVAAVLVLAGPVGQADAVVTGLVRVAPFTTTTSDAKSLTATCPAGTRVIGPGGDTTPGNGGVVLNQIRPNDALTSVTLHANEVEAGTPDGWFLQAFVICAFPPNRAASASVRRARATRPPRASSPPARAASGCSAAVRRSTAPPARCCSTDNFPTRR